MIEACTMRRALRPAFALGAVWLLASACESSAIETTTRQLDRAWDVALLCAVDTRNADGSVSWAGTTMDQCAGQDGTGTLYAFVIQSTRGEVSAVDLRRRRMLDLDLREPLSSPVAAGLLPNAIAASPDGSSLVVANLGDPRPGEDPANPDGLPYLSVVDPAETLPQRSADPGRVYLPAPAAGVAYLDPTHVVVSLPSLSAVAVVTLGEPPVVSDPVVLEPFPLLDPEGHTLPGLPVPWSLLVDEGRSRILVGDRAASRLAWLTWDDEFALTVEGAVDVPGPAHAMAVEPAGWGPAGDEPGRWIYAVDGRAGGVMVLEADTLAMIDLSARDPMEWRSEIFVSGLAEDVVIGRVEQLEPPASGDPEILYGTFGFIVSSLGEAFAVDIEDRANEACWDGAAAGEGNYLEGSCPRHVLRNATASSTGPHVSSAPALYQKIGTLVSYTEAPDPVYPVFTGFLTPDADGDPTYGITFDEDPRRAVSQRWLVEYEGVLPWTDGDGGNVELDGWFTDRAMPFCAHGVLPGDILRLTNGPRPLDEDFPCGDFGTTDSPGLLEYRIAEAYNDRLRLEVLDGGAPLPTEDCFPYAVQYEIRLAGQWLVYGESTGFQHHVISDPTADPLGVGACREEPVCDPLPDCATDPAEFRCLHTGRATEGVVYRNPYLCFTMASGTHPTQSGLRYEVKATGGFQSLVAEVGSLPVAAALDVTQRSGPALLVVDSSTDGLIRVDLAGFEVSDNWP